MEHKSRAIVLKATDFGEADRIVTLFTEDFGKICGVAKNAKKSVKRFGGGFEPGTLGSVRYFEKHGAQLARIEEMAVELPAWRVSGSLSRLLSLSVSVEIADRMLPLSHASKERFRLLERWVGFLGANEPAANHRHAFFFKWLTASGVGPVFDRCALCGKRESAAWHIEEGHGGSVCGSCHRAKIGSLQIPQNLIEYLRAFGAGRLPEPPMKEADCVFERLIGHSIGGALKSMEVLKTIA